MGRAVVLVPAEKDDRQGAALLLLGLLGWLAYTRVFWVLKGAHTTLPACPFLALTGHPCPLCGVTRSFAEMWQGDVAGAIRYHPLGPVLFAGTFAVIAVLGVLLLTGRAIRVPMALERTVYVAAFAVLIAAWAVRLVFLPLPAS